MPSTFSRRFVLATGLAALATPKLSWASANANAVDVMRKSREMRRGFTNSVSDVRMTIESRGSTTVRQMRQYVLETEDSGNRVINVFSSPADVQGVSVLTHSALDGNDDQWIYLPTVGRVKRISSSNRSGAFVGSDFAFEDLSSLELQKYRFLSTKNTSLDSKSVIEVEYVPTYSGTGYSALRSYLDPSHYQPIETHYFNSRDEHVKTQKLGEYKSYGDDGIWRPHHLRMTDHLSNSMTEVVFSTYEEDGTSPPNFRPNRFQRVGW